MNSYSVLISTESRFTIYWSQIFNLTYLHWNISWRGKSNIRWKQYRVMPLLVAMMRTGDRSLSRARFRKEKHSMSSIWTSSINKTCSHRHGKIQIKTVKYKHSEIGNTNTYRQWWTYPWYDLCFALFPPFTHFGINLLPDFRLYLSCVSREESQEALCAAVDDVNLMEGHSVDDLFPLLQLSLRTLYKLCL